MRLYKKNILYLLILFLWLAGLAVVWYTFYINIIKNNQIPRWTIVFIFFTFLTLSYLLLCAIREMVVLHALLFLKIRQRKNVAKVQSTELNLQKNKRVILLYCTRNDFNENALYKSMQQTYHNFEFFILDDSTTVEYKRKIDDFSEKHGVKVIRRKDRKGFKGGNLNNFLKGKTNYDYFAILDSDEILSNNFIIECLKYFECYTNIGIVQANHTISKSPNRFVENLARSHRVRKWIIDSFKNFYGLSLSAGHGTIISRECYESTQGFPEILSEDWAFSLEARKNNFFAIFAPNIICEEDYPVNLISFKKRQARWTRGNTELLRTYFKKIMSKKYKMFFCEKFDFLYTGLLLPLSFLGIFNLINLNIIYAILNLKFFITWPLFVLTILGIFPMFLSDLYFCLFGKDKINIFSILVSVLHNFLIAFSLSLTSLLAVLKAMIGRKHSFNVTIKTSEKFSIFKTLYLNWKEIIFALILLVISFIFTNNFWQVFLWLIPFLMLPYLTILSNYQIPKNKKQVLFLQKNENNPNDKTNESNQQALIMQKNKNSQNDKINEREQQSFLLQKSENKKLFF